MAAGAAQLSVHSRGSDRDRYCNLPKCRWQSTGVIPVPTTYKPYLRVAMPECDRLAFSPLHIKSLKSPPPRHCSYHINQDRRPAMHEQQRHWNSRWVRPLSLKNQCSMVLGDKNDLLYCILPASSHRANKLPESPNSLVQCTDNNKQ